jgi:hypothetical protein
MHLNYQIKIHNNKQNKETECPDTQNNIHISGVTKNTHHILSYPRNEVHIVRYGHLPQAL